MRQWRLKELGDPVPNLTIVEEDPPEPRAGQLLIRTEAVGLAFPDVLQCRGIYQVPTPDGYTPGGESAGTVLALGPGVEGFEVGQRVVALGGGLAEQSLVGAASAAVLPDSVSSLAAAALPINYCTTWFALHNRAHIQAGEWLLVTGAAGGTGTAAIQLGKAAGAKIVAVAGGTEKCDLIRSMGVDVVIDHHVTPDFVDAVRAATGGGCDVAYDPVGGDTFHQVRRCMGWDGRLLVIGFVAGIPEMATNHILLKNYSVVGVHWGASLARKPESVVEQLHAVLALCETGEVDPPLYPPVGFTGAAQALQDLADRKTYGKLVVDLTR
jgi:NADPH2:quinone reductase